MATTPSPTDSRSDRPSTAGTTTDGSAAGASRAMSLDGLDAMTFAAAGVPSANVIRIDPAPFTTWNAVSTTPAALTITPVPLASPGWLPRCTASMDTTDGATAR